MRTIKLNIGLISSQAFTASTRSRALPENPTAIQSLAIPYIVTGIVADLYDKGITVQEWRLAESNTEPTMVATATCRCSITELLQRLSYVASRYAQDCLAVKIGDDGHLVGQNASKWGEFNNEYFIE